MGALLLGLGLVAGLVTYAVRLDPKVPEWKERRRLCELKGKVARGVILSLDEAEDGAVLARRYGLKNLEKKFRKIIVVLRKQRAKV